MNKKKILIISLVIAVLVIGAVMGLYLWRESRIVPELIGTWEFDKEATTAFKTDRFSYSTVTIEETNKLEMDSYIKMLDGAIIRFKKNGKMLYGKDVVYKYQFIDRKSNRITLKLYGNVPIIEFPFHSYRNTENRGLKEVIIINQNQIAFPEGIWLVFRKIE
jgi:hypothetical protein